jgi:hypothetical protein
LFGQNLGEPKQILNRVDAQYSGSAKRGIKHFVVPGQRTCMRDNRASRSSRPANFQHDNWFRKRNFSDGRQKGSRIAD